MAFSSLAGILGECLTNLFQKIEREISLGGKVLKYLFLSAAQKFYNCLNNSTQTG